LISPILIGRAPCARMMPGENTDAPMPPKICRREMFIKQGPEDGVVG
jgi:hypothetical protein